jgi:PadR family transcriptional regulator, regulatory protein PadR
MRRRAGSLVTLEADILAAGLDLHRRGDESFHGFQIAKHLRDADGAQRLTAHGTLYKALGRLRDGGLLDARWEDPAVAANEGRPRRRLYEVTGAGQKALAAWRLEEAATLRLRPRPAGSDAT